MNDHNNLLHSSLIADNIKAYHSTWIIGDHFLKESLQALFDMRNAAVQSDKPQPYLFKHYNVLGHYLTTAGINNVITRFLNGFIEALNEYSLLPKFIIVVPDCDLTRGLRNETGISVITGVILHYVIKQMDLFIDRHKVDLLTKHPNGVIDDEYLKLIWVHMLRRLKDLIGQDSYLFWFKRKIQFNSGGAFARW